METLYKKACNGQYLEKYNKNGDLLRTAEQFNSGHWVVWVYKGKDISGEYDKKTFDNEIRKYFK